MGAEKTSNKFKFLKRDIEAIEATGKRQIFFDTEFPGFTLRVTEVGKKVFYFIYRKGKGRGADKKWIQIGGFPAWSVERARDRAKELAAAVQIGEDPATVISQSKEALRVEAALRLFLDSYVKSELKPESIKSYTGIIEKQIIPRLGKRYLKEVDQDMVKAMHKKMKDTPYLANRTVAVFSKFFSWCGDNKNIHDVKAGDNPCKGVKRWEESARKDYMDEEDLTKLSTALDEMEATWLERQKTGGRREGELRDSITSQSAAAIRLLMYTGARVSEILSLKWEYIDPKKKSVAHLPDSKTGTKDLYLPEHALEVLEGLPKVSEYVFPATSATGHMVNIKDAWRDVLKYAGLRQWRLHDLRHTFASTLVNKGIPLFVVGKILGHKKTSTTERYSHKDEDVALAAAQTGAALIAGSGKAKVENDVEAETAPDTGSRSKVIQFRRAGS